MRKLTAAAMAVLLGIAFAQPGLAQQKIKSAGVRFAFNISSIGGDVDFDTKTGIAGGVFAGYRWSELWGLQAELSYTRKGGKDDFVRQEGGTAIAGTRTTSIDYLELQIPLVLFPRFGGERLVPRVYAGPTIALELSCNSRYDDPLQNQSFDCQKLIDLGGPRLEPAFTRTKSIDLGLVLGVGVDFGGAGGGFSLDARYVRGLSSFHDLEGGATLKNQVIQLLVGYAFKWPG